jgi:hypothetical protein
VDRVSLCPVAQNPWEHSPGLVHVPSPMLRPRPAGHGSTDGRREVANGSGSFPCYVFLRDAKDVRREVFCILEGLGDGLGDSGADLEAVLGLVIDDAKLEAVEQRSFGLGGRVAQLLAEVG